MAANSMSFTKSQEDAIYARNCSLIVSAGAGSGKTAVLTERILERITDENDDCTIADFLVVTFTNAAAKELNDRIRKKLTERAATGVTNKKISTNLALLPLAKISTINSFCYDIVKNNFHKLGLSSNLRIADEAEMQVLKLRTIDECMEEFFEKTGDNPYFIAAYEILSSDKNDTNFGQSLLEMDKNLSNLPDRYAFCKKTLADYKEMNECDEPFDTHFGRIMKNEVKKLCEKHISVYTILVEKACTDEVLLEKYVPALEYEIDYAKQLLAALAQGYDNAKNTVSEYSPKRFSPVKICENESIKEFVSEAKSGENKSFKKKITELFSCDSEMLKKAAKDTENILSCIFDMTNHFRNALDEKKKNLGIIEFSDAERYTLSLLCDSFEPFKPSNLAINLQKQYKEIYIDEYQDVNPLQDLIFKALTQRDEEGREFTRFMVGDIKQSIYRFRGARTDIFASYRDGFSKLDETRIKESKEPSKVFMQENFRCSENVVNLVNFLFEKLMKGSYLTGDRLCFARREQKRIDYKPCLLTFEYDKNSCEGLTSTELEAGIIADRILKTVGNSEFTESEGKQFGFGDVAVLTRSKSALRVYEKVFSEKGIPVYSDVGESFYGKKEILLCLDILNSIDNPSREIYLAGFMRSCFGRITDDELCLIKQVDKKKNLYLCVKKCAENSEGNFDSELSSKCKAFIEKLKEYRSLSKGISADKLLWKLFCEFDMLEYCSSKSFTNDPQGARKNLLKLYEMAREFGKTSFRGIGAFIEYINGSIEKDDIKSEREISGECVNLMTIHASKGLEFPVCFVSNLEKKYNKSDERQRLVFSEKAGASIMLCDTEGVTCVEGNTASLHLNTPFRILVNAVTDEDSQREEMRILYVALTRARDMLFMTGAVSSKLSSVLSSALLSCQTNTSDESGSYLEAILSCIAQDSASKPLFEYGGFSVSQMCNEAESFLKCEHITCEDAVRMFCETSENGESNSVNEQVVDNELFNRLEKNNKLIETSAVYTGIPAKVTVSKLKKGLIEEEKTDSFELASNVENLDIAPKFILESDSTSGAERGTATHLFMQFADYQNSENSCSKEADRLVSQGFIDERQRKLLDIDKLDRFFKTEFYKSIKESVQVYREQRFNLEVSAFELDENLAQDMKKEILVQGVIDLFYKNSDGSYTVVDFKTDALYGDGAQEELIRRHQRQLQLYCKAVEEMTGEVVKDAYLYSFSLMKPVKVEL